jgi:hypothetical protein
MELFVPPESALRELELWKARWDFVNERATCRTCGASQDVTHASRPFAYNARCGVALMAAEFPFRDLAATFRIILSASSSTEK